MAVPYTFGSATTSIPLSQLDSNFATTITLGNTAIQLGNTVTTLNNMTLANVTISSGTSNIGSISSGNSNVTIVASGGNITMATNGATAVTIDTSQTLRAQNDVYVGYVNGSQAGLYLARSNYPYPGIQSLTSVGATNALLLNPAGSSVGLGGNSVVRSVTFNTSEMAMASATTGNYLNLCDANGSNGANYIFNIRGLASSGSAQATLSAINLVASSVVITGSLSKGSGSFRIDHPLPQLEATHHLVHSFIEGPQADLIYRGKVNLINGTATVNIDTSATMTEGTFVALCRNVQCFTTNESDWTAVRGSVVGNILTIEAQDQTSTASISWMVIGERQDKHMHDTNWTDENGRVIVEPLKPEPQEGDLPFEGDK